jgi:hypothetical protein
MFDWSIYRLFVLNSNRDSWLLPNHNIRICFLDMKNSWIKNAFWDLNNKKWRKWCMFVPPSLFNDTYGLPVHAKVSKYPNQVFYVWMVNLQPICAKYGLDTWFFTIDDFRKCLLDMKHSWPKNAFWDVNNKKWRKWRNFVSLSYLMTL